MNHSVVVDYSKAKGGRTFNKSKSFLHLGHGKREEMNYFVIP